MFTNKNSKGTATIWLIIAGFVLIAGGGVYWLGTKSPKPMSDLEWFVKDEERLNRDMDQGGNKNIPSNGNTEPDKQQIEKPQIENQKIDTSTWKTYRNEKYGFEFKYPNALITQEKSGEIVLLDASLEIIHITAGGDPRLLGASFCQARPDNAACETVESLSGKILIYWSDNNRLGEARIDSGQYAILFTQLKQSEEYKKWFKEILFTFRFLK